MEFLLNFSNSLTLFRQMSFPLGLCFKLTTAHSTSLAIVKLGSQTLVYVNLPSKVWDLKFVQKLSSSAFSVTTWFKSHLIPKTLPSSIFPMFVLFLFILRLTVDNRGIQNLKEKELLILINSKLYLNTQFISSKSPNTFTDINVKKIFMMPPT